MRLRLIKVKRQESQANENENLDFVILGLVFFISLLVFLGGIK